MKCSIHPNFTEIGRRVWKLREEQCLTQEALAEAAELSVPYVRHIERRMSQPPRNQKKAYGR